MVLLRIQGEGEAWGGVPLMIAVKGKPRSLVHRLLWLAAIWSLSVVSMAVLALVLRAVMGLAGLMR